MSRISKITELIETNLSDDNLIYPDKHREVEHALKDALQGIECVRWFRQKEIVYQIKVPKGSIFDSETFNNSTLKFTIKRDMNILGKTIFEEKTFNSINLVGGAEVMFATPYVQGEEISLSKIEINLSNNRTIKIL